MKRIISAFLLFGFLLLSAPAMAKCNNAGSIAAGVAAGIAIGAVAANAISRPYNHPYYYRYRPYHHHRPGCVCCRVPVYTGRYNNYAYPAYINYSWRIR